jgi:ketosteroid isomerase-like protein
VDEKKEQQMTVREIHAALERHGAASAAGEQDAEHEIYHDDAIVEYPQSGERIEGRRDLQALRSHHPAKLASPFAGSSAQVTSGLPST